MGSPSATRHRGGWPAERVTFSDGGFTNDLRRMAERRSDVELVGLARLYDGE